MLHIIQRQFKKSIPTYNKQAIVQLAMARHLTGQLLHIQQVFDSVYEFGAGTGLMTSQMVDSFSIQNYVVNDLCLEMENSLLPIIHQNSSIRWKMNFGNAEFLPIPNGVDLVVSNAVMQWFSNLPEFFMRAAATMKPGSYFAFTTFGEHNLIQCKNIIDRGIEYQGIPDLDCTLEQRFQIVYASEEEDVLWFSSPLDILKHLKETGVNSFTQSSPSDGIETQHFNSWTRARLHQFADLYHDRFHENGRYPLTYHPVYRIVKRI